MLDIQQSFALQIEHELLLLLFSSTTFAHNLHTYFLKSKPGLGKSGQNRKLQSGSCAGRGGTVFHIKLVLELVVIVISIEIRGFNFYKGSL